MNTYHKYLPNVFLAKCTEPHEKGEIIEVTNKYGKENEHIVHNLIAATGTLYYYSITRADGMTSQDFAQKKADRLNGAAVNSSKKSDAYREASNEGRDFLALGEPIKIGHHSEKRHRALIERNWNRMSKAMELIDKAEEQSSRAEYWEAMTDKIDLSMCDCLGYFEHKLAKATERHQGLKSGAIKKEHSYSLTYANKEVNELTKKVEMAKKLWA